MPEERRDAIRFIPASFDPYQARVHGRGFKGNDYSIGLTKQQFEAFTEADEARQHPWTWVCLSVPGK